jgi:hypothetical protein
MTGTTYKLSKEEKAAIRANIMENVMPGVYPAAKPGTGPHEAARAVDTNIRSKVYTDAQRKRLTEIFKANNLSPVLDPAEKHHYQEAPPNGMLWPQAVENAQQEFKNQTQWEILTIDNK